MVTPLDVPLAPGDSLEQRQAEGLMLEWLSAKLGANLTRKKFHLPEGGWLELNGACENPAILCEAWAHIGPPKGGQIHKVMADAFKLLYAKELSGCSPRLILLFADTRASSHFSGKNWVSQALRAIGIEVVTSDLPEAVRQSILKAQERQYR